MASSEPPANEVCFAAARAGRLTSILGERIAKGTLTKTEFAVSPLLEAHLVCCLLH